MVVVVTPEMQNSQLRQCPDGSLRASYLPCPAAPAQPPPAASAGGGTPGSAPGQFCNDRGCWGTGTVFTTEAQLIEALNANQAAQNDEDTGAGGGSGGSASDATEEEEDTDIESTEEEDNTLKSFLTKESWIKNVPNWVYIVTSVLSSSMSCFFMVLLLVVM